MIRPARAQRALHLDVDPAAYEVMKCLLGPKPSLQGTGLCCGQALEHEELRE